MVRSHLASSTLGRWTQTAAFFALAPLCLALVAACGGGDDGPKKDQRSAADRTATAQTEADQRDSDGDGKIGRAHV